MWAAIFSMWAAAILESGPVATCLLESGPAAAHPALVKYGQHQAFENHWKSTEHRLNSLGKSMEDHLNICRRSTEKTEPPASEPEVNRKSKLPSIFFFWAPGPKHGPAQPADTSTHPLKFLFSYFILL